MNKQLYLGKVLGAALLFSIAGNSAILSPTVTPVAHAQATTAKTTYTVRSGDTLSAIASRYGVTTNALMVYNGLRTTMIYVNQQLTIPSQPDLQPTSTLRYVVQRGDTLSGLAQRYGTTVAAIQQQNKLRTTTLQVGQTLWMPTRQAPESSPVDRIQFVPGDTSTTQMGTLQPNEKRQYTLSALAGQTLEIEALGSNAGIDLEIKGMSNGVVYKRAHQAFQGNSGQWRGLLPVTQAYLITLNLGSNKGVAGDYTMHVSILSVGNRPAPRPNTPTEQRIQFAPGASSATLFGTIDAGNKVRYHLRARKGQQMAVTISPNSYFVVREPSGDPLTSWDGPDTRWQGSLPVNGEYTIEVMPINAGDNYQLTVAIQ